MKRLKSDPLAAFMTHLATFAPEDTLSSVKTAFAVTRPTTLRVNRLKATPEQISSIFHKHNIAFESVPWYPDAFIITGTTLRSITDLPCYTEGLIYIQNLSSMVPALVLDPRPNDKILDIAAAPGSKTTQMAAMMHNSGSIVANDNSQIRLYKLSANLARQGVTNTHAHRGAGQTVWQLYPEYFDRVLADVPCSMEGRINTNDPDTYKDWSHKKVKELAQIQKFLLRAAVSSAKPGGTIVYSTCTLSPEENEGVIDWLLKKEAGKIAMEDIALGDLPHTPGLTALGEKTFNPQVQKAIRIWPTELLEGFFVAKIRKLDHTVSASARNAQTDATP